MLDINTLKVEERLNRLSTDENLVARYENILIAPGSILV